MSDYNRHKGHKNVGGKAKRITPYDDSQRILNKGWGCAEIKDTMTFVYEDLLNNLFNDWINTAHHETQRREFIFHQAVSLGAVQSNIEGAIIAKNNKVHDEGKRDD